MFAVNSFSVNQLISSLLIPSALQKFNLISAFCDQNAVLVPDTFSQLQTDLEIAQPTQEPLGDESKLTISSLSALNYIVG